MSFNTTGASSGDNVLLGRGRLYFAPLANNLPTAYRDLGNVIDFQVSTASETLSRKNFRTGLAIIDKEIVIEQSVSLNFTLDELTFDNLALFFSGATASGTAFSPNATDIDDVTVNFAGESDAANLKGEWMEIRSAYNTTTYTRRMGVAGYDATGTTLATTDAGNFKLTAGGTVIPAADVEVDLEMGLFLIKTTSSASGTLKLFFQGAASDVTVDEVKGLTSASVQGALKFISENPADNSKQVEYQFHRVTLLADGEMSLIGDELASIPITGQVEQNPTGGAAYGDGGTTGGFVTLTGDFSA